MFTGRNGILSFLLLILPSAVVIVYNTSGAEQMPETNNRGGASLPPLFLG